MARAGKPVTADLSATEELPFDPARVAPELWNDYVAARDAARDVSYFLQVVPGGKSNWTPDEQQRAARPIAAKAALDARMRAHLKKDVRELWARHDDAPILERVLAPIDELEFNYERRTAKWGSLTLYGMRERRPQPSIRKNRHRRPSRDKIEAVVHELWPDGAYPRGAMRVLGDELQRREINTSETTMRRVLGLRE
jgi:hypothetical protein